MGPKPKRETRAKGNFTERQLSAFETVAAGNDAIATSVAAVEVAAGFYGRDLALAEVSPRNSRTRSITPSWLALAGRELARCGSFRCDIQVRARSRRARASVERLRGARRFGPVVMDLGSHTVWPW